MFHPAVYAERRRQLAERLGSGLAVFPGHDLVPMNYAANPYVFRQDASFLYYFGLDAPGLTGTLDADTGDAVLYGPDPTLEDTVWEGPLPPLAQRAAAAGVEETRPPEALESALKDAAKNDRLHLLPPYRAAGIQSLKSALGRDPSEHVSEALIRAVVAQRSVKTDEEVAEIERAIAVDVDAHRLAMRTATPGVTEQTIAGQMLGLAHQRGSHRTFGPIVTARGEVLHNHATAYELQDGDLLLVDAGFTTPGGVYASDLTRAFPVSGTFSEQQRGVYETVLKALEDALDATKPGALFKDIHLLAARRLTEGLQGLGLMTGDVDASVEAGAHALFFPHGLGHMMGLDVHDMEALGEDYVGYDAEVQRSDQFGTAYLRLGRALAPGFVITVEPGCYFIPPLIDQWQAEKRHADFIRYDALGPFRDFGGVRIEEDVLVTNEGHRVLGPPLPRTVEAVEAACRA